jgi:transcriptional regulator with XRE-family HTH domain
VWDWTDHASYQALRSGDLGAILRAYRRINGLSQEKLAAVLGYDKTYISMIETGRRAVHDVATRRHMGKTLAIPSHLLGVTDPADTDFVAMVAFAESTIRLAELARSVGRAADAVNELWPLVARLEARAAEGHLEQATLTVLGQAWVSLGVSLGTVLQMSVCGWPLDGQPRASPLHAISIPSQRSRRTRCRCTAMSCARLGKPPVPLLCSSKPLIPR